MRLMAQCTSISHVFVWYVKNKAIKHYQKSLKFDSSQDVHLNFQYGEINYFSIKIAMIVSWFELQQNIATVAWLLNSYDFYD